MAAYNYLTLTGVIVADTAETKQEVQAEFVETFGEDLDLSDESPEGVLINAETITRNGVATNNAALANQINPNLAGGVFLDAIWSLTRGLTGGRLAATASTFSQAVDLTGVAGTFIGAGAIATVGPNGAAFESLSDVTLDVSGLGSVAFQSVETGPIAVGVGELDTISAGSPLGWETVSNPVAATLGRDEEGDEVSRFRRIDQLALQGISVSEAVTSAVSAVENVKSLSYRENFTDLDTVIDGVFLLKHSVYACVDGGADADIWQALLDNKTVGANWNGSEAGSVQDLTSGQYYDVAFDRPTEIQTWIRVSVAASTVSNPNSVVTASVLRYVDGLIDGERGFVVSADVSPFEIAGAVNRDTPELFVNLVEVSTDGIIYAVASIEIEIDEVARTNAGQIITVIA